MSCTLGRYTRSATARPGTACSLRTAASFPGFVLLGSVTQDDVSRAICIWEAPSLDDLQRLLDGMFGPAAALNDCFVADPARSFNLPAPQTAAGAST